MEEEYEVEDSLCGDMLVVNIKNIKSMLKALREQVLDNPEMDTEEELYFLRAVRVCLNFNVDIPELHSQSSMLLDCSTLSGSITSLLRFWCERHSANVNLSWSDQFVLHPGLRVGHEEFVFKRDFAFGVIHILEICQDLLHIVESACVEEELQLTWEKVFYIVTEVVGEIAGYSSLKGFDLGIIDSDADDDF